MARIPDNYLDLLNQKKACQSGYDNGEWIATGDTSLV
jgi:hypothetical protein